MRRVEGEERERFGVLNLPIRGSRQKNDMLGRGENRIDSRRCAVLLVDRNTRLTFSATVPVLVSCTARTTTATSNQYIDCSGKQLGGLF